MIRKFYSLEDLYNEIKQDRLSKKTSCKRFPVRFTFINSFEELQRLIAFLVKEYSVKYKDIEELLPSENIWLTPDNIIGWVKRIRDDAIVVLLSEFLRFQGKNNFRMTLNGLTEIEKPDNIRIYVPLVGLWERFGQEFWESFSRRGEWAPVWKLETPVSQNIVIYQINFDLVSKGLSLEGFTVTSTIKEWLNLWKGRGFKNILSVSRCLSYFYREFLPDQIFRPEPVSNPKEFLQKVFKFQVPIEFRDEESAFWNELIKEVSKYGKRNSNIEEIFLQHFNLRSIEGLGYRKILELYLLSNSAYEKWLIKSVFLTLNRFRNSYLYRCFEKSSVTIKGDLIRRLWLEIFDITMDLITEDIFSERKNALEYIHHDLSLSACFIEKELANYLEKIRNIPLAEKLKYLTDITFVEREYIIYEVGKPENTNTQEIISMLRGVYPLLAYYLDWDSVSPDSEVEEWIIEYFKEYNWSKVRHRISPRVTELINEKNHDISTFSKWYYSLRGVETGNNLEYVWVDGLGAEWFPLVIHLLDRYGSEYGKVVKERKLVRATLPTTTECNKYEFKKVGDLDRYIHDQSPYKYPDDLVKEIDIVDKIIRNIIDVYTNDVCIVSDHGFSFLCLKELGNFKKLDFPAEHDGRCMWIDGESRYSNSDYFIRWKVDEGECQNRQVLVALKHVSLSNTPYREVHGGATPEEVILPYIIVETEKSPTKYKVEVITPEVWVGDLIQIKIIPHPLYIPKVFSGDRTLNIWQEEKHIYSIDLKGLEMGQHSIVIKIGKATYQVDVTIKGGYKERELL